ncbi:MAG: WYL domain-containing protein [Acidimicrobiales bacterium]
MSSKLERLLNLTALLLNTERPLKVDQIGQLMEGYPPDPASFRRTFERDKDDLREMGIPVEVVNTDPGDQTALGYRILPEKYYLPDPGLDPDELAALKLAMGAVRLDGIAAGETLRKLGASSDADAPELASVPTPPEIGEIHAAIAAHRLVEFTYHGELRTVEPHRLDYQRGRWYLSGFDRLRDDRRSFRIDRIEGGLTSGDDGAFEPPGPVEAPPGLRFEAWRYGDDPPVTARLRIDASQAGLGRDHAGADATWTDLPDGSAEVEMIVSNRGAFRSFVMGFLDHAEILEPEELRQDLVDWLKGCLA